MGSNLAYQEEPWDEMIDGKIVMMSPRPTVNHNIVAGNIFNLFFNYLNGKSCTPFGDGTDLYLTDKDRFVPDGMIVCNKDIIKRKGIYGVPDLVVEVLSPSTARNDRGHKKDVYEAAGVREYWIVEPDAKSVEVYLLKNGKFVLDDMCIIYPDYFIEKMTEDEQEKIKTEFQCSLFHDLVISLDDVFDRTF